MVWEKDNVTVSGSNIYPDLTDKTNATYTNTLHVSGREPGMYTCRATDGNTLSLSSTLRIQGITKLWYVL